MRRSKCGLSSSCVGQTCHSTRDLWFGGEDKTAMDKTPTDKIPTAYHKCGQNLQKASLHLDNLSDICAY